MPLQTFLNLSVKRQAEIVKIANEEFVFNTYKTASLSKIIRRLGLAKGSFYRYFKSKSDLYSYLVEKAYELRMDQLGSLLQNNSYDFFGILRENFRNKIIFDIKHPLESILLFNLFQEGDAEEVKHLYDELKMEALNLTKKLIVQFQEKGELSSLADPEMAALFIFQTQLGIYEYLYFFKGIDFKKNIHEGKHVFSLSEDEIMEVVDRFLLVIMFGLEKQ